MKSKLDFNSDKEYKDYLRKYFSGLAMQGILSSKGYSYPLVDDEKEELIEESIECADELIKQLAIK